MIVEYIIHSGILNYTKLAFNSLKMIRNDTVSQPIKQVMIGLQYASSTAVSPAAIISPELLIVISDYI